jgi:hypothetical protein
MARTKKFGLVEALFALEGPHNDLVDHRIRQQRVVVEVRKGRV